MLRTSGPKGSRILVLKHGFLQAAPDVARQPEAEMKFEEIGRNRPINFASSGSRRICRSRHVLQLKPSLRPPHFGCGNDSWQRGRLAPARRSNNGNRSRIGGRSLLLCLAGAKQLRSCDRRQDLLAHPSLLGNQPSLSHIHDGDVRLLDGSDSQFVTIRFVERDFAERRRDEGLKASGFFDDVRQRLRFRI